MLATITLQQTGWLAIILVFGPKGLVLRSSMALIPTETSSIFLEWKIHKMNFNMINQELIPSYYHISVDVIVIHRKITRIQDITSLGSTPITELI